MTQQRGHFFLDVDDDVGLAQLFVEARILALQLFHFVCQGMALGLGPAFLRSQGLPNPLSSFSSPIHQQRGVQTFATEKRAGTGAPLRCGSLRSPPLRSAPAPAPETTPREFLFILILLFLALLINYDYWKCLRDIGTEGPDRIVLPD